MNSQSISTTDYATREIYLQSWWLAAELARRHPRLRVYETHPGGGMYDVLMVIDQDAVPSAGPEAEPRAMLNRVGSLQVHSRDSQAVPVQWADLTSPTRRWDVLGWLEQQAGWGTPNHTPPSTPRTLAYRSLASALDLMQYDRHTWDVRSELLDTAGYGSRPDHISLFPSAAAQLAELRRHSRETDEPVGSFWTLLRDQEPILIVCDDGAVHRRNAKPLQLLEQYQKHERRIRWTTASLLRKWL